MTDKRKPPEITPAYVAKYLGRVLRWVLIPYAIFFVVVVLFSPHGR
jgi:hypothetical protein